ncbi:hypothetical protein OSB04_010587 [Centaurea solstitialis]|uniref:B3 domain-containing protein n=1 Tax=Centaurea solstitialis TaxID=347529 RepID=A0AA38T7W0_9ASTR|nr:hypothetical protein OSB04_010587 [Centaurea solstitialis]
MKSSCPSSHKKSRSHRSSMAAKQKMSKEDRCRKNIATFLDLMEFKDINPTVTTDELLERLRRIEEKQSTVVSKQSRTIRKITFKFNEKAPVIIPEEDPTMVLETPLFYEGCGGKDIENTEKEAMVTEKDSRKVLSEVENPNFGDDRVIEQVIDNGGAGELLRDFIRESGGSSESTVLVVEKRLTKSDVNRKEGRLLLMPILHDKVRAFLTAPEKERLDEKKDIEVTVFDPKLRKSMVNLRSWKMKQKYLVFKTGWNQVVVANKLRENMVLQVWSFRVDEELRFALLRVDDDGRDV